MEILVAIVIISLSSTSVAMAVFGSLRGGSIARERADLNVLITSFGESIKALPYYVCGTPDDYWNAFSVLEDSLDDHAFRLQGKLDATLKVDDVQDNGPEALCPGRDSGVQLVSLSAATARISQNIQIIKRNPSQSVPPPTIDFEFTRRSSINSPLVEFGLLPKVISQVGVHSYEWWCYDPEAKNEDGTYRDAWIEHTAPGAPQRPPDFVSNNPNDPGPKCAPGNSSDPEYHPIRAPSEGSPDEYYWAALRVTDNAGVVYPLHGKKVKIPTTTLTFPPPSAFITQVTNPTCEASLPCIVGDTIGFDGRLSKAADGRHLVKCVWRFSDGSEPVVFTGSNCASSDNLVEHVFYEDDDAAWVELRVTDDLGRSSSVQVLLVIDGVPKPPPTVVLKASVLPFNRWSEDGQPPYGAGSVINGVAPQNIYVSAEDSYANGAATITSYSWDFGDGGSATGPTATHSFSGPSNAGQLCVKPDGQIESNAYRVQVTVKSSNGSQASASLCVKVDEFLSIPPFFRFKNLGVGVDCTLRVLGVCVAWNSIWIEVYFQWNQPPMAPGDEFQFEIRTSKALSTCVLNTGEYPIDYNVQWTGSGGTGAFRQFGVFSGIVNVGLQTLVNMVTEACRYQVRTIRIPADGSPSVTSAWSDARTFDSSF